MKNYFFFKKFSVSEKVTQNGEHHSVRSPALEEEHLHHPVLRRSGGQARDEGLLRRRRGRRH